MRIGVDDLAAEIKTSREGIATGELVVIADMVEVVDVADPDGNEVRSSRRYLTVNRLRQ